MIIPQITPSIRIGFTSISLYWTQERQNKIDDFKERRDKIIKDIWHLEEEMNTMTREDKARLEKLKEDYLKQLSIK